MALAKTDNEPDERGRLPIVGFHFQPKLLPVAKRRQYVEVDDADARGPQVEPWQTARPWLTEAAEVEWDVTDRPDAHPSMLPRKLAQAEARIDALVSVAESKTLLTRKEVEDEVTRSREPVEDKPTRTR